MRKARLVGEREFTRGIMFAVLDECPIELFVADIEDLSKPDRVFRFMGEDWQGVRIYKEGARSFARTKEESMGLSAREPLSHEVPVDKRENRIAMAWGFAGAAGIILAFAAIVAFFLLLSERAQ